MPEFNGDGTGYSARATDAMWELVQERFLDWYIQQGVRETWEEFLHGNSLDKRGDIGSYGFDTALRQQLEYEITMPDEMWMLIVDLVNWSEITDTLLSEFKRVTEEMDEAEEDEDEDAD
jgi:hypothetical protein